MSLSNFAFTQQKYDITQINNTSQDSISSIIDIHFIDCNTGYLTAVKKRYNNQNYIGDKNYVFKTIDGGNTWTKKWENPYGVNSKNVSVSFVNSNTGYISKRDSLYRTTNGGNNWNQIPTLGYLIPDDNIICAKSNGDVYLIQKDLYKVYKYSSSNGFQQIYDFGYNSQQKIKYVELSKLNDDVMYICGYKNESPYNPFFAKSTNGGANWNIILDGSSNPHGVGQLKHMSITNNGISDIVKISGANKLIEYQYGNQTSLLSNDWGDLRKISFGDASNGYYLAYDGGSDDPPENLGTAGVYKTTNGGQTWNLDLDIYTSQDYFNTVNKFYSKGNITYFTRSGSGLQAYFYARKLDMNLNTLHNNISSSGSFKINNIPYNTSNFYYLRGGTFPIWTESVLNSGTANEKIFYKWNNNNMNNEILNYNLINDGDLSTHYKTKQKSAEDNAISNVNQTKGFRGSSGITHQIHSSIGGIFYTASTYPYTEFRSEEVVNGGQLYSQQFANSNTADNNKNPSINEINYYEPGDDSPDAFKITSVWERYDQPTNTTDILCAVRSSSPGVL